uniref:Uncharacterized protein n=1 Tax=Plectus sambesii TaxID=2011161 RepID=A0A914W7S7_9BILA
MSDDNCQALVPYTVQQSFLAEFRERYKTVSIDDSLNVTIEQNWNDNGVAGVLWDSAIILARYVATHRQLVVAKRVLELGAGTGLPSMAAVHAGASSVIATDIPSAIDLLQGNIARNVPSNSPVTVRPLIWGRPLDQQINLPVDLILGADLVYNEEVFEDLKATLLTYASNHTTILMTSRIRYPKDRRFYRSLGDSFDVRQIHYDSATDVRLYEIILKERSSN